MQGASELTGLCVGAAFPALGVLRTWRIGRRLDGLGVLSLLFIAASLVVGILTNNPTLVLLQGPAVTGSFALAVLASLLLPRPPVLRDAPVRVGALRRGGEIRRAVGRTLPLVDARADGRLRGALPVSTFLLLSPVVDFAVAFGLIRWGSAYAHRAIRSAATSP